MGDDHWTRLVDAQGCKGRRFRLRAFRFYFLRAEGLTFRLQ
ncbi:hypothetical protein NSU_0563 [Novosphingobium pentaromativorans US6-1]|uniref:Uncharacterized protein n=1 Tax=Novosphingobium pentaromativorans US6-1 TaxID=1088721 RepID=G6E892_9SPHN|nr:hypothetical protein NSU_0563 [Novosphingobium pentaromativorans US6-1]